MIEPHLRDAWLARDLDTCATAVVRDYGPDIAGFLVALLRNRSDAAEVFSMFCEDLWRGLPQFAGRSTLKTWSYTVARHAALRYLRDPRHKPDRFTSLTESRELAAAIDQVRTTTLMHKRSEIKDRIAQLRDELDPDDRALLVLRIDRGLPWRDVARVLDGDELSDADLDRRAATLRKRLERLKHELREKAAKL